MANRDVRLSLFEHNDFQGRRIQIRRGGIAIRDARALRFNDMLSSFRLRNVEDDDEVTLILFEHVDYRGETRVYRGNTNVRALNGFNDRMSSLIVVGRELSDREVNRIRNNRRPPRDVVELRQ
ncbi:hypothetical protein [Paenibacillus sp.]|uniref:hypothetical protein n=1 Tax=Paenibacillus sp. TaxID=58172 RepID=UPI002D3CE415|nr:hypothetical protein [Paenibacillus sp.]HZG85767.1 hypothetical protein [Paenibacillus sp.]